MTVDAFYQIVNYIINKSQQGNLSPANFNLLANQSQTSYMDYLLGEFQQYQYGRPVARVEFGANQTVRQRLTPFIYGYNLNVDVSGHAAYPYDFQQVDAMWNIQGNDRVRFVQQDYLYSYLQSKIDPVETNPIYLIEDIGFRFYPTNFGAAKLSYVKTPKEIKWAYTLDGNGRPVYDAANSIDPVWLDVDMLEIIARLLKMVGVNLQAAQVSQYANQITTNGQ